MVRVHRRRRRSGFTLMEVLLVLAILVILGGLAVMTLSNVMVGADKDSAKAQIGLIKPAVEMYFLHVRQYPSTATGLEALRSPPGDLANPAKWQGPYMKDIPLDPWDRPYQYASPGKYNTDSFDIWSLGPDGQDGSEDDIGNWTVQTQ